MLHRSVLVYVSRSSVPVSYTGWVGETVPTVAAVMDDCFAFVVVGSLAC